MREYNRVMLGKGGMYAEECRQGGFIGVDFDIEEDLTPILADKCKTFNEQFIPKYLASHPEKSKISAGLSGGYAWTVCCWLKDGDIVLSPDGNGAYNVAEICGPYYYAPGQHLQHRRKVKWMDKKIQRSAMSEKLRNSIGSIGTTSDVKKHAAEIDALIGTATTAVAPVSRPAVTPATDEKPAFHERHLHKLFCHYLNTQGVAAKTIFHEKSTAKDAAQKWVHPDIVGVSFTDFHKQETTQLMKAAEPKKSVTIISYELKRRIASDYDLKQCFFQALSNSNWANQGYLVAFEIDESIYEEMKRLNDSFGIGVILLQPMPEDTKVLLPAKEHELDYNTIDKLANINSDFCTFINKLSKVMLASKDYAADAKASFMKICDEVFNNDEEIEKYCKDNNIPF